MLMVLMFAKSIQNMPIASNIRNKPTNLPTFNRGHYNVALPCMSQGKYLRLSIGVSVGENLGTEVKFAMV